MAAGSTEIRASNGFLFGKSVLGLYLGRSFTKGDVEGATIPSCPIQMQLPFAEPGTLATPAAGERGGGHLQGLGQCCTGFGLKMPTPC